MSHLGHGAVLCALFAVACSHNSRTEPRKQADGSYKLECTATLARCLAAFEAACPKGYEILHAREDRKFYGPDAYNQPVVTSDATARCHQLGKSAAAPATSDSAGAVPKSTPAACVPGATQACVGPGACRGGQQCLASGAAFGPCDCGTGAPLAPTSPAPTPDAAVTPPP